MAKLKLRKDEAKHDKYFEGHLQLRNIDKELMRFVRDFAFENNLNFVDEKRTKTSFDCKVSNNKAMLKLGNILVKVFSGYQLVTRKLYSQDKMSGKRIYRMTLLFKQLPFDVGDIINDGEDEVKVVNFSSKNITVRNLKSGKKYFLDISNY